MSHEDVQNRVPVLAPDGETLTPCTKARARQMIDEGKATPHWNRGVFCVRLRKEPSGRDTPDVACGIDPGSKEEGFSVKSKDTTYLNIQARARTGVQRKLNTRRNQRRQRRKRNCPNRKPRFGNRTRSDDWVPPSTKARWQWKLRIVKWLNKIYPIDTYVVEDVKAETKEGQDQWNENFSPVQAGKQWFYDRLQEFGRIVKKPGWRTSQLREQYELDKSNQKADVHFNTHCVDAWVLASNEVGGDAPANRSLLRLKPYHHMRRQLHYMTPKEGGERPNRGGTNHLGFKKGSLIYHERDDRYPSYGYCLIRGSGTVRGEKRLSLKSIEDGSLLTQKARPGHCEHKAYMSWYFSGCPC